MARFNRINVGGNSDTITALAQSALTAGTIVNLKDQPLVVIEGYQQGLGVDDPIPSGDSFQGGLLVSGYQYAIRVSTAGSYAEGDALEISSGKLTKGTTNIVAYAKETATLVANDLLLVRIK